MKLVIAEKKELASAIYDAIPGRGQKGEQTMQKGEYTITWCSGHLLRLKEPEDYDPAYKTWSLDALPIYFPDWEVTIGKSSGRGINKGDRLKLIGELLAKCEMVIHAGDCDDEGQLIIDEVLRWHKYTGPVMRLNTTDTTEASLYRALGNMRPNDAFLQREGWAAYARSVSDAIVGFNITRAMTLHNNLKLTIGRVQTPTLGLVVYRDSLIEGYKKIKYFEVFSHVMLGVDDITARYVPSTDDPNLTDDRILSVDYAKEVQKKLTDLTLSSIVVSKKKILESPPLPFNLIKLQVYCSSKFGYENVMEITQSLRDKYKAITYNRSDCRYLGEEHFREAPNTVKYVLNNTGFTPAGLDTTIRSKCFDQSKISAHFAIIPTANNVDTSKMTEEEKNVYMAIAQRYLMQFLPPAEKLRTTLKAELSDDSYLIATSTEIVKPGYRAFANGDSEMESFEEDKTTLSAIAAGQYSGLSQNPFIAEKETKPPQRYTVASLKEDMTRISKYVKDPEAKRILIEKDKDKEGENGSIGTTATRDMIVSNLIQNGYLAVKGKHVVSTPLGRELYRVMPDDFRLADTTAKWWAIQECIKEGTAKPIDLIESVLQAVRNFLACPLPTLENGVSNSREPIGKCPGCGGNILEYKNAYGCANWSKDGSGCNFVVGKKNPKFEPLAGVTLSANTMQALLQGKKILVKNIPKKNGTGTYNAELALSADENGRAKWIVSFPEKQILGRCPICGGNIIEGKTGYGCSNWKEPTSCKFYIAREQSRFQPLESHKITPTNIKTLLAGKAIRVKNIPKKDGSGTYEADFTIDVNEKGYVQWKMSLPKREPLGRCPLCGGNIIEGKTGYGCSNWKEPTSCKFYIARDQSKFQPLSHHKISPANVKSLLAGKPICVKQIPKKNGNGTYAANFFLSIENGRPRWNMEFIPSKPNQNTKNRGENNEKV